MGREVSAAIAGLREAMKHEKVDPTKGLPEDLFVFATSLIPCSNVDLFVTDPEGRLLLIWREDEFYGKGWHIPGGCLRMRETALKRIQETAKREIGSEVLVDLKRCITREAISTRESLLTDRLERSHNISLLFPCRLPEGFRITNEGKEEHTAGYKKWFDAVPEQLLSAHRVLYGDLIEKHFSGQLSWPERV